MTFNMANSIRLNDVWYYNAYENKLFSRIKRASELCAAPIEKEVGVYVFFLLSICERNTFRSIHELCFMFVYIAENERVCDTIITIERNEYLVEHVRQAQTNKIISQLFALCEIVCWSLSSFFCFKCACMLLKLFQITEPSLRYCSAIKLHFVFFLLLFFIVAACFTRSWNVMMRKFCYISLVRGRWTILWQNRFEIGQMYTCTNGNEPLVTDFKIEMLSALKWKVLT